jgi:hypothetical protein
MDDIVILPSMVDLFVSALFFDGLIGPDLSYLT